MQLLLHLFCFIISLLNLIFIITLNDKFGSVSSGTLTLYSSHFSSGTVKYWSFHKIGIVFIDVTSKTSGNLTVVSAQSTIKPTANTSGVAASGTGSGGCMLNILTTGQITLIAAATNTNYSGEVVFIKA